MVISFNPVGTFSGVDGGPNVLSNPTSLQFGPDGRLYVSEQNGSINAFTVSIQNGEYIATDHEELLLPGGGGVVKSIQNHNDDGTLAGNSNRQVTGIVVAGTATEPVLYISSSDPRIATNNDSGLDTNSGVLTKVSWNSTTNEWEQVDLIRGLPRSEENHSVNGMVLSNDGTKLYLAVGGHTNNGAPSQFFTYTGEYALSGTVLEIDLTAVEALPTQIDPAGGQSGNPRNYKYDLPTLDDPNIPNDGVREDANGMDVAGPWGGNDGLNMAILPADAPLRIFADGLRNNYDLAITADGRLYTVDNGSNGNLGGNPNTENGDLDGDGVPDEAINTPNNGGSGDPEPLFLIEEGGYYGHPAPVRANQNQSWTVYDNSGNPDEGVAVNNVLDISALVPDGVQIAEGFIIDPSKFAAGPGQSLANLTPQEQIDRLLESGVRIERDSAASNAIVTTGSSTNGIVVYDSNGTAFDGYLDGKLFVTQFNDNVTLLNLNSTGDGLDPVPTEGPDGIFGTADDGVQDTDGILFVANNSLGVPLGNPLDVTNGPDGTLWVAEIGSNEVTVLAPSDVILPGDNDSDDDGILNVDDPFLRDATNGTSVTINPGQSTVWEFSQDAGDVTPGPDGFGGGLTGVMIDGTTDFEQFLQSPSDRPGQVIQLDNVKFVTAAAGGTTTIEQVTEGDPFETPNDGEFLFHTGFQLAGNVETFTVQWVVSNPGAISGGSDITNNFQQIGGYIGDGTQSNYLKIVAIATNNNATQANIQIALEDGDTVLQTIDLPANGIFDNGTLVPDSPIVFELEINPGAATATPQATFSTTGGDVTITGSQVIDLTGSAVLDTILGNNTVQGQQTGVATGLFASNFGSANDTFQAVFDSISVTATEAQVPPNAVDDAETTGVNAVLNIPVTQLLANDTDANPADTLTVTGVSNPQNGTVFLDNGIVTFTPALDFEGEASFDYDVTDGTNTVTATVTVTVADRVLLYRVNAGGPQIGAIDGGLDWTADTSANNSPFLANPGSNNTNGFAVVPGATVADTTPAAIFTTERWDQPSQPPMQWAFDAPVDGQYEVRLFMGNGFNGTSQPGERVFDVAIEGTVPDNLNDLDLSQQFGHLVGAMITNTVAVTDGTLNIEFLHGVENPLINGIEIIQVGGDVPQPIPEVNILNATQVVDEDGGQVFISIATDITVPLDETVDVNFTIEPISADTSAGPNGDYEYTSASAIFAGSTYVDTKSIAGGSSDLQIPINILPDDLEEGAESFKLTINSVSPNATLGANSEATVTIAANDTVTAPGDVVVRINAGGPEVAANDGSIAWTGDQGDVTNGSATTGPSSEFLVDRGIDGTTTATSDNVTYGDNTPVGPGVNNTGAPDALFTTERFSSQENPNNIGYAVPLPDGEYTVNLYFDELFFTAAGARIFDVEIENALVLDDFDTFATYGNDTGVQSFDTTVSDGVLNIEFLKGAVNNPHIAAIEIIAADGTVYTPPLDDLFGTAVEISGDRLNPTDAGPLALGNNFMSATQEGEDGDNGVRDRDIFTVTIPDGFVLTGIELDNFVNNNPVLTQGFLGIQLGDQLTVDVATGQPDPGTDGLLGGIIYNSGNVGQDLLDIMALGGEIQPGSGITIDPFDPALTGDVTVWLNQGAGPSTADLNFILEEVAAPIVADLELVKVASDTTPVLGDTITFTLTVNNVGTDDATGVSVEDLLPNGLAYVSDTSGGTYNPATGIWDVGTVPTGGSQTLDITVVVAEPVTAIDPVVLHRINVGGPELAAADGSGPVWSADTSTAPSPFRVSGSNGIYNGNAGSAHPGPILTPLPLPDSVPTAVFNTERFDTPAAPPMAWEFAIDPGTEVEVRLYFAELFGQIGAVGDRLFDVEVEGVVPTVFDDIDQFAIAGAKGAFSLSHTLTVTDGILDIDFIHVEENPALKGIEILELGSSSVPNAYVNYAQILTSDQPDPDSTPGDGSVGDDDDATVTVTPGAPPVLPVVNLSVSPATASEADATAITVTLTASAAVIGDQTVDLTLGGLDVTPDDFTGTIPTSLTIPDNQTTASFTINVNDDALVEALETATFSISNPSAGLTLGAVTSGTVEIADNDFTLPVVNIVATDPDAAEELQDPGIITVTRTGGNSASPLDVLLDTSALLDVPGETNPDDFDLLVNGVLTPFIGGTTPITFDPGVTEVVLTLVPVDDAAVEGPETRTFTLFASPDYELGTQTTATVTIADNDDAPNTAPAIDPLGRLVVNEGETATVAVTATDAELNPIALSVDVTNTITNTVVDPAEYSFTDNGNGTGTFTWLTDEPDDGIYSVAITASDGQEQTTETFTLFVNEIAERLPGDILFRVNAGGAEVAAIDGGPAWTEDTQANNSPFLANPGSNNDFPTNGLPTGPIDTSLLTGFAVPEAVLGIERWDNPADPSMQWAFPVAAGTEVELRLYLAEIFTNLPDLDSSGDPTGDRLFDVSVDGVVPAVFDDIDPYTLAGGAFNTGTVLTHTFTSDGAIDLEFLHISENPAVKGIEIVVADPTPVVDITPPTVTLNQPLTPITAETTAPQIVEVTFADDIDLDELSVDGDELLVTNSQGVPFAFTLISFDGATATYEILPPGGTWDTPDNETYSVEANAGGVIDVAGNSIAQTPLGTFEVNIPELVGAATFSITLTSNNVQASNFGNNSFQITNVGDKDIEQITLDVTNALYPDSVFDPFGVAGDTIGKLLTINSGGAETGVAEPTGGYYIGAGGTAGFEAIQLDFTDFNAGETLGFSVDMDPNSIAGATKSILDSGAVPPWDIGGISGAELIGSTFTVTFTDGTQATGQLQGAGNQGGSQGLASQDSPNLPVTLTVNGLAPGGVGTYDASGSSVIINGPAGETARVVLTKGIIQPANNNFTGAFAAQLDAQLAALAASDFPANNAAEFQTVDVLLDGTDQDISSLFDFTEVPGFDLPGNEAQVPLGFVAGIVDFSDDGNGTNDQPIGPVTTPIYLQFESSLNTPPAIAPIPDLTILEGETADVTITATDVELDAIALAIEVVNTSTNTVVDPAEYTFTDNGNGTGSFSWLTDEPDDGVYTVTVTASDAEGQSTETFILTVNEDTTNNQAAALIEITPDGGLNASTFSGSSFQITNTSEPGVQITSVSFDLSTGILPDMVFDPTGSGGDATASPFTPNSGAAETGLVAPADPAVDPFSQPRNGGFDVLTIDFTDFDPGEQFFFTTDVDPNNIQGVSGAGDAGAVSGYELIGSTVTVNFSDGRFLIGSLYEDGSLGGSQVLMDSEVTAIAPTIELLGAGADESSLPGTQVTVLDDTQTVRVNGTPGDNISLLQMDARLFIASGDPPFDVAPDELPFYANEAMAGQVLYSGVIGADGFVDIPVTLLETDSGNTTPDGGLNHFIAVTSPTPYAVDQPVSQTSNTLTVILGEPVPIAAISVDDPTVVEGGDSGETTLSFALSASELINGEVDVEFTVTGTPATVPLSPATVTFVDGVASLDVTVANDDLANGDEVIGVELTSVSVPSGSAVAADVAIADGLGTGTVTEDDFAPVPVADVVSTPEDVAITFNPAANDTDADNLTSELTVTAISNVSVLETEATVELINGEVTLTPLNGFAGDITFDYTVADPGGNTATGSSTVTVEASAGPASAYFSVNAGAGSIDASSFSNGSFVLTNTSEGGQTITSAVLDISTALLPSLAFDPVGTAGDTTAKALQANSGAAETGFQTPASATAPFSSPIGNGGFQTLTIDFTDFDPGETFTFSVDIDPTSIQGEPVTGPGSVSGLELVGSTITLTFADGTQQQVQTADLFTDGSNGGSEAFIQENLAPELTFTIGGVGSGQSATVTDAAQVVSVQSNLPEGTPIRVLVVEGAADEEPPAGEDPELGFFETNKAIALQTIDAVIGANGSVDVPVTLTQSPLEDNDTTGINYITVAVTGDNAADGTGDVDGLGEVATPAILRVIEDTPPSGELLLVTNSLNLKSSDQSVKTFLENLGYTVTVQDDNDVQASDANGKAAVLISESVRSGFVGDTFTDVAVPVLSWEAALYDDLGMASNGDDQGGQTSINIVNGSHPLGGGLANGLTQIYNQADDVNWGVVNDNAIEVATLASDSNLSTLFGYEAGAAMVNGTAPARRVGLFLGDDGADNLTPDGQQLLESAIAWLLGDDVTPPDVPGITLTETTGSTTVTENGAGDLYSLVLDTAPTATVTVTIDPDGQLDLGAGGDAPIALTFDATNWDVPQTVLVNAFDDADVEGLHTGLISHTVTSADGDYDGLAIDDITVAINDNDAPPPPAGITLSETGGSTNVTEGGASDTYTLVLDRQPTADVVIILDADGQVELSDAQIVFTASNWNVPQTVTVTAFNDPDIEGNHSSVISHSVSSADADYAGLAIDDVTVSITDDDGVTNTEVLLVTNSFNLKSSDQDFKTLLESLGYTVTVQDDNLVEASDASGKALVAISESVRSGFVGDTFTDVAVPVLTWEAAIYDDLGMANNSDDQGGQTSIDIVNGSHPLGGGLPNGVTQIYNQADDVNWGVVNNNAIEVATLVSDSNLSTLFGYETGAAMVNGTAPARRVGLFLGADGPDNLTPAGQQLLEAAIAWAVGNDTPPADIPGITLTEITGSTTVAENGPGDLYTIVLDSVPTAAVTVTIDPDDQLDLGAGGDTPISLTFDPSNWNVPQTVLVNAVDDAAIEGPHTGVINHTVASGDGDYNGLVVNDITVAIADDDAPPPPAGITLSETNGSTAVTEGGNTDTYSLVLDRAPTSDVVVTLAADDQITLSQSQLVFTASNWNVPQDVTVTAVDDQVEEGPHGSLISHSVSSADTDYNGLTVDDVSVEITDNDEASSGEILLVVGRVNLTDSDQAIKSRLEGLGYTVTVQDDSLSQASDATGKALVAISESVVSGRVSDKFANVDVGVLSWEAFVFDDLGMTGTNANVDFGDVPGETQIDIINAGHPLAAGLSGTTSVYTSPSEIKWGVPNDNAIEVATLAGDSTRSPLFAYDTGAQMVSGIAPARRTAFFLEDATDLSAEGGQLFDAAVEWTIG